jgi:hypothetical protein
MDSWLDSFHDGFSVKPAFLAHERCLPGNSAYRLKILLETLFGADVRGHKGFPEKHHSCFFAANLTFTQTYTPAGLKLSF